MLFFLPFLPSVSKMETMAASASRHPTCISAIPLLHVAPSPSGLPLHPLPCRLFLCPIPVTTHPEFSSSSSPGNSVLPSVWIQFGSSWPPGPKAISLSSEVLDSELLCWLILFLMQNLQNISLNFKTFRNNMTNHAVYNLKANPTKIYIFLWICIYGIFIFPSRTRRF